jgi:uncharacterized membrane protein
MGIETIIIVCGTIIVIALAIGLGRARRTVHKDDARPKAKSR